MKILVVDDERNLRDVLSLELSSEGFNVECAESGLQAIEMMGKGDYEVVLLDLNMPGLDGMEVLKKIRVMDVPSEVIVLTGHGTVSTAVKAMKLGAYDYITKPFKLEELRVVIQKVIEKRMLINENLVLKSQLKRQARQYSIITRDPVMLEIIQTAKKTALSDMPVLITGESGVGKELIARSIHAEGNRSERPFVTINCGSIPENMLESELFGHEKGSFTGATSRKPGLLEVADTGVLFLDEIGELPLHLQAKILRAIETGRFFRLGAVKEVTVDVKFVSATNKDIESEVEKNNFRADLYYRISVLKIHLPPLRLRKGDIPLLAEHFITGNPAYGKKTFGKDTMSALMEYAWPGNVRELQNVVNSILLLSEEGVIGIDSLPSYLRGSDVPVAKRLKDVEREYILKVFKETGGHRGKAARILGIDPKTLYRKLTDYGVRIE